LQTRARDYLERVAAELDARRRELGVEDNLAEVEGMTPAMMVALGEADIKTIEDLAGCATDDLVGWTERKQGETVKHKGAFFNVEVSSADAEQLIMAARVKAGWIEPLEEPSASETTVAAADA
jgi:N utilization substance protein A